MLTILPSPGSILGWEDTLGKNAAILKTLSVCELASRALGKGLDQSMGVGEGRWC